jgi:hypothetical protein
VRGQLGDQPLQFPVGGIAGRGHAQVGDEPGLEAVLLFGRADGAVARAGEVAPDRVALDPVPGTGLAHQRVVRLIGRDQVPRGVVHGDRSVREPAEQALHARRDACRDDITPRHGLAREPEEQSRSVSDSRSARASASTTCDDGEVARPCSSLVR